MRTFLMIACATVAVALALAPAVPSGAQTAATAKPTTVFFMCPHGAGKSVLASAYFQKLAKERGLNVRVDSGGTEPDPAVSPVVATHLQYNGMALPVAKPRLVTPNDLAADIVVSLGCDLKGLPAPRGKLLTWDDVPGPGQDLNGSVEAIRKHAEALVDELTGAFRRR